MLQISGSPEVSERYRAGRLGELLELAGRAPKKVMLEELESWGDAPERARFLLADVDLVILHRLPYSCEVEAVIAVARNAGIPVAWETDDLVFVPGVDRWVDGVRRLGAREREHYLEGVERYQRAFRAADAFIGSTPFLAQVARRFGKPAYVLQNTLCPDFFAASERLRLELEGAADDGRVVIGYGAGTATHDRDFRVAAAALEQVLDRHPEIELHVVGEVKIPQAFERHAPRVRRLGAASWADWPAALASFDINVAPLEGHNPYCRAKSALKYFEAASLGVPTVASDSDSYRRAIVAGENGFLATTEEEWVQALESLIVSRDLRRQVGEAARRDVTRRLSPEAATREMLETLGLITEPEDDELQRYVSEQVEVGPLVDVAWLVPTPFPGSGGHNDIFQICHRLEGRGIRNTLHVETSGDPRLETRRDVRDLIHGHFVEMECEIQEGWQGFGDADLAFATHWSSVPSLRQFEWEIPPCYFVQDFEPLFYRPGEYECWQAESTYRLGLNAVTLGPWLAGKLREEYGSPACHWDLPVDRRFYGCNGVAHRPGRLAFFAQPGKPRRAYELGIEALQIVAARVPEVEIVMFGSDQVEVESLPFAARSLGVLTDAQLADLYRESWAGFTLSYTNPSLVPVSMLACGCPLVDLDVEPNARTYPEDCGVLLAAPDPESVASTICRVLTETGLREELSRQGIEFTRELSFERGAGQVEGAILRAYLTGSVEESLVLDSFQGFGDQALELAEGSCAVQDFRCASPVLERIDVRLSTLGRPTSGGVEMVVYDEDGEILGRTSRRFDDVEDLEWARFCFRPMRGVAGKRLLVCLTGPDNTPGRAPGVVYTRRSLRHETRLSINEDVGPGSLAMRTYVAGRQDT
ncbi:MAG: glycosyltransferase [bacterium]|nr:glycosyltransferase [bacterium]